MQTKNYDELIQQQVRKSPAFAAAYLSESFDEGEEMFLMALRHVVDAHGGLGDLSEETSLGRQSLYRALSKSGNPRLSTLTKVLSYLGFKLAISPKSEEMRHGRVRRILDTERVKGEIDQLLQFIDSTLQIRDPENQFPDRRQWERSRDALTVHRGLSDDVLSSLRDRLVQLTESLQRA